MKDLINELSDFFNNKLGLPYTPPEDFDLQMKMKDQDPAKALEEVKKDIVQAKEVKPLIALHNQKIPVYYWLPNPDPDSLNSKLFRLFLSTCISIKKIHLLSLQDAELKELVRQETSAKVSILFIFDDDYKKLDQESQRKIFLTDLQLSLKTFSNLMDNKADRN